MIYEYTATDYKFATPFNFILLGTFYIALHILQETITQTFRMRPVVFVVGTCWRRLLGVKNLLNFILFSLFVS